MGLCQCRRHPRGAEPGLYQPERAEVPFGNRHGTTCCSWYPYPSSISVFATSHPGAVQASSRRCWKPACSACASSAPGYIFFAYGMVISHFQRRRRHPHADLINLFCFWMLEILLAYFLPSPWAGAYWRVLVHRGSGHLQARRCWRQSASWVFRMGDGRRWISMRNLPLNPGKTSTSQLLQRHLLPYINIPTGKCARRARRRRSTSSIPALPPRQTPPTVAAKYQPRRHDDGENNGK